MNDILEKLKANWMIIAAVVAAYFLLGGKKGGKRSTYRKKARIMARRTYGRMRKMRRR
jgi:hypothetical protein